MRRRALWLAALAAQASGRCSVSYVNSTVCGGYGDCYHLSGPGRHWLGDAECVCKSGYCSEVFKRVAATEGTVQVWTCWPCVDVRPTATQTMWANPVGATAWMQGWQSVVSSVGGEWASISCPSGSKTVGGGCRRLNETGDTNDPVGMWTALGPDGDPPSSWDCGGSTTGMTDGGEYVVSASTGSGGGRGQKEVFAVCADDRAVAEVNVTEAAGAVADCPDGWWLLSGGCRADSAPWETSTSAPLNDTAWFCGGRASNHTAWAVCTPHLRPTVVSSTGTNTSTAACPSGYVVTGGGCAGMSSNATASMPANGGKAWQCVGTTVVDDNPVWVSQAATPTAYAICVPQDVQWCGPGQCKGCARADLYGGLGGCSWETCRSPRDCQVRCAETAGCIGFDYDRTGAESMRCWFRGSGEFSHDMPGGTWHYYATTGARGCTVDGESSKRVGA
eukprot:TRINITY_DN35624_c0_g1_i1.p1 TRINITY_DN35624_c0_g1~~TRINITY_DN35624_c0_g1_i1.p1  ORF type:complete len:447 (+),score=100.99 TRINITY_DN35624_c0_g1_i1:63-1403(+)